MTAAMARSSSSSSKASSGKPSSAKASKKPAASTQAAKQAAKPAPKAGKAASKAPAKAAPKAPAEATPKATEASAFEALQALHVAVGRFDQAAARELSLKRSDVACLRLLSSGGKRASEIGQALGLTSGSVTALIDRLQAAKLVKRSESDADRRAIHVELMPATQRRLVKAYEPLIGALDSALGGKKRATVDALIAAARSLSAHDA
jgi:DNA-binding MarR family transcriptional regulator